MNHIYEAFYADVKIRPLEERDIEALRVWRNDKEKTKFLRPIEEITPKMQKKWYEEYLKDASRIIFAIEETAQLKRLVGSLALYHLKEDTAEIGKIQIGDEDAHKRGIGRKSMVMALTIAFQKLGIKKVTASVNPENKAAYLNDLKIGFQVVGEHKSVASGIEKEIEMDYRGLLENNLYISDIVIWKYGAKKDG